MTRKTAAQRAAEKVGEQPPSAAVLANQEALKNPGAVSPGGIILPEKSGETVYVACKLGVGWYDLQLTPLVEKDVESHTGRRKVMEAVRDSKIVRLRGTSYPRGTPPEGFPEKPEMIGGYAITRGVPKDFWDQWREQFKRAPFVENDMIHAEVSHEKLAGWCRERAALMSGLEPIRPDKDARLPKPTHAGVSNLETEEARAAKMAAGAG